MQWERLYLQKRQKLKELEVVSFRSNTTTGPCVEQ